MDKKYIKYLGIVIVMSVFTIACKSSNSGVNGFKSENDEITFTSIFIEANQQKILGNLEAASVMFQKCIKINPKSAAAHYELAGILLIQNKKEQALEYSEQAFSIDPKNIWYGLLKVELTKQLGRKNDYLSSLEKLCKLFPDRIDIKYDLAAAYAYLAKIDQAIKVYDEIQKKTGPNKELRIEKYRLYLDFGKQKEAEEELNDLIKVFPKSSDNYRLLSEFYVRSNRMEEALWTYDKMLELDPEDPYTHFALYDYYTQAQQTDKAFFHLKKAFKGESLNIDTKVKVLFSFYNQSEKDETLKSLVFELLSLLESAHPEDAKTYSIYGDFLFRENKLKEARSKFKKALTLEPNKYLIWRQIIVIDSELNDYDQMYNDSEEALDFFPTQPELYWFKGVAAIQAKRYEKSIDALKSGVRFVTDNNDMKSQFYSSLGDAYHGLKDHALSDESYDKSLRFKSNNAYVLNNYAYYLSLRKNQLEKAAKMSKESLAIDPKNVNFLDTYGWILFELKQFEESLKYLEKAFQNGGDKNKTVLGHLGDVYAQLNQIDKAKEFWHQSIDQGGNKEHLLKKITQEKFIEELGENEGDE